MSKGRIAVPAAQQQVGFFFTREQRAEYIYDNPVRYICYGRNVYIIFKIPTWTQKAVAIIVLFVRRVSYPDACVEVC